MPTRRRISRLVYQLYNHFLGYRREVPHVDPHVHHVPLLAPPLVDVPMEQPLAFVKRSEAGKALGLTAVALVRKVAGEDLLVAEDHRARSLADLLEPDVEVLLLQAKRSFPMAVPAAIVVPRVEDLVPGESADEWHGLLPLTHGDVTEDVDSVFGVDHSVPIRDERFVHLVDAVEGPVAVPDDVLMTEVQVSCEIGGHRRIFAVVGGSVDATRQWSRYLARAVGSE